MATIKFDGFDSYVKQLDALSGNIEKLLKRGVYDGAAVVANAVRASIASLPVVSNEARKIAYGAKTPVRLSDKQKEGLLEGLTLTLMTNEGGFVNTKLTFAGYNSVKTQKYPNGQPNIMIAASVEGGSSATKKQPFMRSAAKRVKSRAAAAMEATVTSDINNLMEGK